MKASRARRISFEKVFYHLDQLYDYVHTGDTPGPVHMIVGLTNVCNHACIFCHSCHTRLRHYNEHNFAPTDMVVSTIEEAARLGLKAVSLVGTGEPTLHPDFSKIVRKIRAMGVEVGLFTNGSRLDEDMIQTIVDTHTFLRLSCSAGNREDHNRIQHAGKQVDDFDRIVANVRTLLERRGGRFFPTVGVQFVVIHHNWRALLEACRFWKGVGVDYYAIKPAYTNLSVPEHEENTTPLEEVIGLMDAAKQLEDEAFTVYAKYEQFETVLGTEVRPRSYDRCHGQAFMTFLDPDGNLYVCGNMEGKEEFSIGNVMESGSFEAVWNGSRRRQLLKDLDVSKCLYACRMDPLNWIIEDLLHPDPEVHSNFL